MVTLTLLAIFAMLLTLGLTPVCRLLCQRLGWVDHPGPRKVHLQPIPRTGGIAIFMGYAAALCLLFIYVREGQYAGGMFMGIRALLPAILVAFATGLLDDILGLKPWMKLLGQFIAAVLACNAGVQIHGIGGYSISHTLW